MTNEAQAAINHLQEIRDNETYKLVLKESFGGVMYNVANQGKYDSAEVLQLWDNLSPQEKNAADGIMTGAISFMEGN